MLSAFLDVLHYGPVLCRGLLPVSVHFELYSGLICGTNLPANVDKQAFLDTGLIHLMVVSGAHLLFLEALLVRAPSWIRFPLLGTYCWMTGFGPPVVKAFAHRVFELWLRPRYWRPIQVEAVAVLSLLLLQPAWLMSRSFQMSWMCSLALYLPRWFHYRKFDQAVKSYFMLFVFTGASLLSIAWNTLLAPFVGMILFPICLSVIPLPFLLPVVDGVWDLFLWLLSAGPQSLPSEWYLWTRELFWIPPLVHFFLLQWEVRRCRVYVFSSSSSS
jgi:predicted membrane metal-binding protein